GLFTTLYDCGGEAETPADVLDNLREQVILAEDLGFDAAWLGEHHFGPYGLGDLPNPILVGADLAVRTRRIRIGQMANIAPWWHPIRLAEDLAILDNLTRGRVDVGFGRGIWPYEGPQFHPHADPRKDAQNRELFRETVEIVRKAWTEERFAHQGANYTFPPPAPGEPTRESARGVQSAGAPPPPPPPAPPAALDDRVDRPLGQLRRGARAPAVLLAAAAAPRSAAHGALRRDPVADRGPAGVAVRGPGRAAEPLRRGVDGDRAARGRRPDPVGGHL